MQPWSISTCRLRRAAQKVWAMALPLVYAASAAPEERRSAFADDRMLAMIAASAGVFAAGWGAVGVAAFALIQVL